jgi:hypothetical protein
VVKIATFAKPENVTSYNKTDMEYHRTEDGQIQADMARRLGIILKQYYNLVSNGEKYEVTLSLSILQTLLTNCIELMNSLDKRDKKDNPLFKTPIDSEIWGILESNILVNSFLTNQINVDFVIRHIRNALSHPTKVNSEIQLQTTGYSTIQTGSNIIENIYFVSSPDLNGRGNRKDHSLDKAKDLLKDGTFPAGVEIEQLPNNRHAFTLDKKPFYRIFKITFAPRQIAQLAFGLSNYLSQPLNVKWDGKTFIINNLAA